MKFSAVKRVKGSPKLDMNPMVDMAFLLVTFFMLATTFKTEEVFQVESPSSTAQVKLPERNIFLISIHKDGKVAFGVDGKQTREKLLEVMGAQYDMQFNQEEKRAFSLLSGVGVPLATLKSYLAIPPSERKSYISPGIPVDSSANELRDWVVNARIVNPRLRVAVRGDRKVTYPTVRKVINTLVDENITRFNLVTEQEGGEQ